MYCLALELDAKTNKILFEKAQRFVKADKFYMINKFHFTIITLEEYPTENQVEELKNIDWSNIYFGNVQELEGKNTDMNYLALNLRLEDSLKTEIEEYRKKHMRDMYFPLIPHISLLQTEDVFLDKDIDELGRSLSENTELGVKSILIYGPNRNILKKVVL